MVEPEENAQAKRNYNPVSLGTLYFSFSLPLWSNTWWLAGISSFISLVFFASVFSERFLAFWSKIVKIFLIPLTFVVFVSSFSCGFLQTAVQTSEIALKIVLYFGFAWVVVFLLILMRPPTEQSRLKKRGLRLLTLLRYGIVVFFAILAAINYFQSSHLWDVDFWSGTYSVIIAALSLSVATGLLKVHGEMFEVAS